jgi:hypothetical protein
MMLELAQDYMADRNRLYDERQALRTDALTQRNRADILAAENARLRHELRAAPARLTVGGKVYSVSPWMAGRIVDCWRNLRQKEREAQSAR